jgi:GxxExxY protein
MNTDEHGLKHSSLTSRIIGVFFDVYNELGPGFLESVYAEALALALSQAGLWVEREILVEVAFRGRIVGRFRADLIVGGTVLVETKACSKLHSRHEAQVLNYLRATILEVGLLLNFGPRPQFKRLLFDNPRKTRSKSKQIADGSSPEPGAIRVNPCSSVAFKNTSLAPCASNS